jgi:hypothetical protein
LNQQATNNGDKGENLTREAERAARREISRVTQPINKKQPGMKRYSIYSKIEQHLSFLPRLSKNDSKVFPFTERFRDLTLIPMFKWVIPLCMESGGGLVSRFHLAYSFINRMILLRKFHGQARVVKQLKADHVALQRAAGGNPLKHMRELEPTETL